MSQHLSKTAAPKNRQLNQEINEIRQQALSGVVKETEARQQALAAIIESGVCDRAVSCSQISDHIKAEVGGRVREEVAEKVMKPASKGGFDLLQEEEHTNVELWAYRYSQSVIRSAARKEWDEVKHFVPLQAALLPSGKLEEGNPSLIEELDLTPFDENSASLVLETIQYARMRGAKKNIATATLVCVLFALPDPERMVGPQRYKPLQELNLTPALASRSAFGSLHAEGHTSLDPIWVTYTDNELERVSALPPEYSAAIAYAAVGDYPRPLRDEYRAFLRNVGALSQNPQWKNLAFDLVASVCAVECEHQSPYALTAQRTKTHRQRLSRIRQDAQKWPELIEAAAVFEDHPLGKTPDEVARKMHSLLLTYIPAVNRTQIQQLLMKETS